MGLTGSLQLKCVLTPYIHTHLPVVPGLSKVLYEESIYISSPDCCVEVTLIQQSLALTHTTFRISSIQTVCGEHVILCDREYINSSYATNVCSYTVNIGSHFIGFKFSV